MLMVDDDLYENVGPERVPEIVAKIREKEGTPRGAVKEGA